MRETSSPRSPWLTAAAVAGVGLAAFFVVLAVLSLASGHGAFSGGVAVALLIWAVIVAVSGVLLWRGRGFLRGVVVAAGLLHVFAFGQMVPSNPWALLGSAAGLVCVVAPLLPSSRAGLSRAG